MSSKVAVAGYIRVSTEDQAREGISLAAQEERLKAYCVAKDWELVALERDEGLSAKTLDRPGLVRILALVETRQVAVLLTYKLDRLTRSVVDLAHLLETFKRCNIDLVSLCESLDATTAMGRLMMNLLASVSQWERELCGERTKDAMAFLKSQGRSYCSALYGFRHEGDRMVPVQEEQEVIRRICQMREDGLSYLAVAKQLNTEGVPTAKVGGRWFGRTVHKIVKRVAGVA